MQRTIGLETRGVEAVPGVEMGERGGPRLPSAGSSRQTLDVEEAVVPLRNPTISRSTFYWCTLSCSKIRVRMALVISPGGAEQKRNVHIPPAAQTRPVVARELPGAVTCAASRLATPLGSHAPTCGWGFPFFLCYLFTIYMCV